MHEQEKIFPYDQRNKKEKPVTFTFYTTSPINLGMERAATCIFCKRLVAMLSEKRDSHTERVDLYVAT